jgi:arginyl-tRNA synthetase
VLGADHHGTRKWYAAVARMLGYDPGGIEVLLYQLVHLVERGAAKRMSKRRGDVVFLDDFLDAVGVDAARWHLVSRGHDQTMEIDVDLAAEKTQKNPVYYVQYAHARIASILRKAVGEGATPGTGDQADEAAIAEAGAGAAALDAAAEPAERALIQRLFELPGDVSSAAARRAPHRLCAYATSTAADFHAFYRDCQVVGAPGELEAARLAVCVATKRAISTTLALLGVTAPERM